MVAKIGHGANISGALSYNQGKVQQENGQILFLHNMLETRDGTYNLAQLARSFEPYLLVNCRTEKPVLHISLNPDPRDKVSDEDFKSMAQEYMQRMGYGAQPFVVFKHTDIERSHIHIISVCVDEAGKKIPDAFERRRSMAICRSLEQQYKLVPATEQSDKQEDRIFRPVDYKAGNIKSQVASVVRYLPAYYQFQGFGAYNALLSLYNITAEEVKGELQGKPKQGLVYFALDGQGRKASNPFKASLFGKAAGYAALQEHYEQSKEKLKDDPAKAVLRNTIEAAMHTASDEKGFKQQLREQGIDTVVRSNAEGRVYGMTFIDHPSRTVWNGSHLGKELSANVFNDWWNNGHKPETKNIAAEAPAFRFKTSERYHSAEKPADPFHFLGSDPTYIPDDTGFTEGLGGLLPEAQGEDYEEQIFANEMKKRKKKARRKNPK